VLRRQLEISVFAYSQEREKSEFVTPYPFVHKEEEHPDMLST